MRDVKPWYSRKRRSWYADVPVIDSKTGKPVRNPTTGRVRRERWALGIDEIEAHQAFHERMAQRYRPEREPIPRLDELTVLELAERWLEWNRLNRSPRTAQARRTYLRWLIARHGWQVAGSITPQHLEAIKAERRQRNKPRSINHFVNAVKGLFYWAVRQGLLKENPLRYVQRVAVGVQEQRALSAEQVGRALEVADTRPPLGDVFRFLYHTGLRMGEVMGAMRADYDAERGILTLREHKTVGVTHRARVIPLSAIAQGILAEQVGQGPGLFAVSRAALENRWKRLKARHPELHGVTFHSFRHTFAARARAAGANMWDLQAVLGHSSMLMSLYYAPADLERMRAVAEAVK